MNNSFRNDNNDELNSLKKLIFLVFTLNHYAKTNGQKTGRHAAILLTVY